jgi:23S rRNA-/tRNA-specific pseudouridylate synthase
VGKTYLVRVQGHPVEDEFQCDAPIGREAGASGTREVAEEEGAAAITRFVVRHRLRDGTALLEAYPLTGRTNQIRIHCAHLGFPVLGDAAYSGQNTSPRQTLEVGEPPLGLHAWKIDFAHPASGEAMNFTAAPPAWAITDC